LSFLAEKKRRESLGCREGFPFGTLAEDEPFDINSELVFEIPLRHSSSTESLDPRIVAPAIALDIEELICLSRRETQGDMDVNEGFELEAEIDVEAAQAREIDVEGEQATEIDVKEPRRRAIDVKPPKARQVDVKGPRAREIDVEEAQAGEIDVEETQARDVDVEGDPARGIHFEESTESFRSSEPRRRVVRDAIVPVGIREKESQDGFRIILRDKDDAVVVDANVKSRSASGLYVLEPSSDTISLRIKHGFSRAEREIARQRQQEGSALRTSRPSSTAHPTESTFTHAHEERMTRMSPSIRSTGVGLFQINHLLIHHEGEEPRMELPLRWGGFPVRPPPPIARAYMRRIQQSPRGPIQLPSPRDGFRARVEHPLPRYYPHYTGAYRTRFPPVNSADRQQDSSEPAISEVSRRQRCASPASSSGS
jgi:hypothetical protein